MNKIDTSIVPPISKLDTYEKGYLFEEYVIELFNKEFFNLVKWRKSQRTNDRLALLTSSYPDLELIFAGKNKYKFAVECKWRKEFYAGKITWAEVKQINSYETFEYKYRIPVFVAIGIGGEPCNPKKLFVTPLCNISGNIEVHESNLIPYNRKPTRRFFYDTVQLKLF
ncbi:MAG: hypothetical protein ACJ75B_03550 [Flavisolibacter sp.]